MPPSIPIIANSSNTTTSRSWTSPRMSTSARASSMLAQALVEMDGAQASLIFDGSTSIGQLDETVVIGTKGTLRSTGPDLSHQTVTLTTERGTATPVLTGKWFNDAFRGTMGELLLS